jgi:ATP-dependent Clp protease ATP-binding subunit ClpA
MEIQTMATRVQIEAGAQTGKKDNGYSVSERYTEAARTAISHARSEALNRDSAAITVADLLAGLSHEENTRAERIGSLKANACYLRWLSGSLRLPSQAAGGDCQDKVNRLELDVDARRALAFAVLEADHDREYWIDTDHLLRGLMRFPNKAHFAVLKTEMNLKAARVASRRDREEFLPEETPSLKVVEYLVRKHFAFWISPVLSLACYLYILIQSVGPGVFSLAR